MKQLLMICMILLTATLFGAGETCPLAQQGKQGIFSLDIGVGGHSESVMGEVRITYDRLINHYLSWRVIGSLNGRDNFCFVCDNDYAHYEDRNGYALYGGVATRYLFQYGGASIAVNGGIHRITSKFVDNGYYDSYYNSYEGRSMPFNSSSTYFDVETEVKLYLGHRDYFMIYLHMELGGNILLDSGFDEERDDTGMKLAIGLGLMFPF